LFQFLAYDVVTRHMLGEDRKFFPYLRTQVAAPVRNREAPSP